ncbi:MAG: phenylalanine--tRNA ligase subunit beta [Saprospiraceae bacterium]
MNISLNWLKEFITIDQSPTELAETLTNLGLAVDGFQPYESIPGGLTGVVVGKIIECIKHPNADRLSLTKVDIGTGTLLQIVCGAPNVATGQTVLVATTGSILHTSKGEKLEIKKGKIRGEVSEGMICAGDELSLSDDHSGIIILPDHLTVGTPASDVYPVYKNTIFEVDLTPNRSDATSHMGVAKDLAAYYAIHSPGHPGFIKSIEPEIIPQNIDHTISVVVEDSIACPRYSGICISGVTIKESPDALKSKLKAIGVRPINNVVDITNYILHSYGQPLHAFDLDHIEIDSLTKPVIRVKKLPSGTKFVTLDGVERSLHQDDLMICNSTSSPICIAGVFGGLHSGITDHTQNIFLESAHFNASSIRRTSMRHVLRTDAATRFEKGTDPNITVKAIKASAAMIIDLAGGIISSDIVDAYSNEVMPASISISFNTVRSVIGQEISDDHIINILNALEMQPSTLSDGSVMVKVPTNKADVKREIDVIEEILRIHGFNNVPMPSKMEVSFVNSSESSIKQKLKEETADLLCHLGFNEMMGLSLMESRVLTASGYTSDRLVYINNTSNVHLDVLRPDILRSGLSTLQYNQNRQQTDLKLFEFGKSYHTKQGDQWPFEENDYLTIYVSGLVAENHWQLKESKQGFFYLKGILVKLLEKWGITEHTFNEIQDADYEFAHQFEVKSIPVLQFGKLANSLTKSFDLRTDVYFARIDWNYVWTLQKDKKSEKIIVPGKYPSVRRDLAIMVEKSVSWDLISSVLNDIKIPDLKSFDLFDIFEDKDRIGKDKKSLAISIIFENLSQTLKESDLEKSMGIIQAKLSEKTGAIQR